MTATPRIPPNDQEAEAAVLASMLFDRDAIAAAYEILSDADFYSPANGTIYSCMVSMFSKNVPVDVVTLTDKLAESGQLDQAGGREQLIGLGASFITSANIKQHAGIVWQKSILRKLIKAADKISGASFGAQGDALDILNMAEKTILEISRDKRSRDFAHIGEVLESALKRLGELYANQGKLTGVETGFADFDRRTSGLQPSDLVLIGARPSMGKTAFLLNIAQHAAVSKRVSTAFFSLEMSKEQLGNRMLASKARVDAGKIRSGELDDDDWEKIAQNMGELSTAPLYIDDTPGMSVAEMRAKCRRLKADKDLGLVVVDYLQLMCASPGSRPEARHLEVSEISRSLKGMAKEFNVPFLVAAQLNRSVESRKDHKPLLSDLRESGAIEQDADLVAFLYRDEYYNPETLKKNHAEVIIAKQRNGPTGTVELVYHGALTRFDDMDRSEFPD